MPCPGYSEICYELYIQSNSAELSLFKDSVIESRCGQNTVIKSRSSSGGVGEGFFPGGHTVGHNGQVNCPEGFSCLFVFVFVYVTFLSHPVLSRRTQSR